MPRKKVEIPVDTFKVFIRFPNNSPQSFVKKMIEHVTNRKDEKILFLPRCVEVIVVDNKGQTKVF